MKYSTNELLIAGMALPQIIDIFEKDLKKGVIELDEIIEDKSMIKNGDGNYSKEYLNTILESLVLFHPILVNLCERLESILENRSVILNNIGLGDYSYLHYTKIKTNIYNEISDYNRILCEKIALLDSERIDELDLNPQVILNEIEVLTNKLRKVFNMKDLNELIENTMNKQKLLFMDPRTFYFHLIDLIELEIE